jgi:phosphoribosylanthranilate isomerase
MRYLTEPCPDDQAFRFQNGQRARSLEEFRRVVQSAPPDVVQFHRDHYQHWVRDILQDPQLATRIQQEGQRAKDGEQLKRALDPILAQPLQAKPGTGAAGAKPPTGGGVGRKR